MKKKLQKFCAMMYGKGNLNIRQRLLRLLLLCSFLVFVIFAVISLYGFTALNKAVSDMGSRLSEAGAEYTRQYIDKTSRETLLELSKAKAVQLDRELELMRHDVNILADTLTWIKTHEENYAMESVRDPYAGKVPPAEPYIIYSPELRRRGIATVRHEVGLLANAKGTLIPIEKSYGKFYSACYFGSKEGYLICSSVFPGDAYSPISDDEDYDYDPRVRPWYQNAIAAGQPIFSLPYLTILTAEHDDIEVISCSTPYYDQDGIAGVASLDMSTDALRKLIFGTTIGEKGMNFVMTRQGKVVFSPVKDGPLTETSEPQDLRTSDNQELAAIADKMANGESGLLPLTVYGEEYFVAFAPIPTVEWSLGVLVLKKDMLSSLQESQEYFISQLAEFKDSLYGEYSLLLKVAIAAMLLMFLIIFLLSGRLSDRFVQPIHVMADGVREIASGDMNKKLDIKTGDELEHLAVCFNAMTAELKEYMENLAKTTAKNQRIETELNVATNIQQGVLPHDFDFQRSDFDLFASMHAAKEVGGDFYDFYMLDDRHLAVTVADVSGKGVPAALFMMRGKTILKNLALMSVGFDDAAAVLTLANQQLCQANEEMMFITVFFAILDVHTGELIYVNGGHNPPLVSHRTDKGTEWTYLRTEKKSRPLGVIEDFVYTANKLTLAPGDTLFLYTDGVTEAMNTEEQLYGEERLQNFLNHTETAAAVKDLIHAVQNDIDAYENGAEQFDDITMLGLRYTGPKV